MAMKADPVTLTVKASKSENHLDIQYRLYNGRPTPIFIFNRLWRGAAKPQPDGEGAYRFVVGKCMRLLLGSSPLPHSSVAFRNVPEVTKLAPFASFDGKIALAVPVTEYNFYFSNASEQERVADKVDHIELFAEYAEATGTEVVPSRIHAGAFDVVNAEALESIQTLRSGPISMSLEVLRQTGEYTRLIIPGDPDSDPVAP